MQKKAKCDDLLVVSLQKDPSYQEIDSDDSDQQHIPQKDQTQKQILRWHLSFWNLHKIITLGQIFVIIITLFLISAIIFSDKSSNEENNLNLDNAKALKNGAQTQNSQVDVLKIGVGQQKIQKQSDPSNELIVIVKGQPKQKQQNSNQNEKANENPITLKKVIKNQKSQNAIRKTENYPQEGISYIAPTLAQKIMLKKQNLDIETFQLAKRYFALGVEQPSQQLIQMEKEYYEKKYKIRQTFETTLNRVQFPFCIVIPSYNNAQHKRYMLALASALRQDYQNYHIVYVNDASTDATGELVEQMIKQRDIPSSKVKLINKQVNSGALESQYEAALNECKKEEIFLLIDGDDGLVGTQTLKLFNHFYQTTDSWFIYGNYLYSHTEHPGVSRKMPKEYMKNGGYRKSKSWITSHPKSFYNILFHKIKKSDLMDRDEQGKQTHIFKSSSDRAVAYPVVEMAGTRVHFIQQLLYLYLAETPYTSKLIRPAVQNRVASLLSQMPPEKQLSCLFQEKQCVEARQYLRNNIKALNSGVKEITQKAISK